MKRINVMMIQYKIKKKLKENKVRKAIGKVLAVIISIVGCALLMGGFAAYNEDESTIKMIGSATNILVILELYDRIQKMD